MFGSRTLVLARWCEFYDRTVEVVGVVGFDNLLVETEPGSGKGWQLENFKHDCHHHDEAIGPVLETFEILVLIPLLARADLAVFNSDKGEWLVCSDTILANPQSPKGERVQIFRNDFSNQFGVGGREEIDNRETKRLILT